MTDTPTALPQRPPDYRYVCDGTADIVFEPGTPTVVYGGTMLFLRLCPHCARFATPDGEIAANLDSGPKNQPNATCSKHGRVKMIFEGYIP